MLPLEWRRAAGLSQAAVAAMLGIGGKNPSRTWQRYEAGEREPPITIVVEIERHSRGKVTAQSWVKARDEFQTRRRSAA